MFGGDLRLAPLVSCPETVRIAWMLAARERRRMRGTWSIEDDRAWLDDVGEMLDEWQVPAALALVPVKIWMQHHSMHPLPRSSSQLVQGKWRRLPAPLPHEEASFQHAPGAAYVPAMAVRRRTSVSRTGRWSGPSLAVPDRTSVEGARGRAMLSLFLGARPGEQCHQHG